MILIFPDKTIKIYRSALVFINCLIFFSVAATAQEMPKEIRGYKVYQAEISIKNQGDKSAAKDESAAFVKIGEPEIKDVSLTGITLAISAEIDSTEQSGTIDFLTFKDFRVNNLKVSIDEYKESFDFKKNGKIVLPKPIEVFISTAQTMRGALAEFKESKEEWTVTGRIFVFGHFKKSFIKFKRVVPVEINLKIKKSSTRQSN